MTQEEKAMVYDEAVKKAEEIVKYYKTHNRSDEASIEDLETIFPELKESEDERIRKGIKSILEHYKESGEVVCPYLFVSIDEALAWLKKQGEQTVEPDWCHHKVDFSGCSEEYRKAYYDGWNSCNIQHSQHKAEFDDVIKCLVNGFKYFYSDEKENEDTDWGDDKSTMSIAHIVEVLEKHMKSVKTE